MRRLVLVALVLFLAGCASLMSSATSGMAANLGSAILNQDDPETVRDGAPAFLLMLDGFVEGSPRDAALLMAAAELYAAYGAVFVDDPERAQRLTDRSLAYARRALCVSNALTCDFSAIHHPEFLQLLNRLDPKDVPALYTFSISWLARIQAGQGEPASLARLPRAEAALRRVSSLDPAYRPADVQHYLGVLTTLRPPALGGDFEAGQQHFERAIELAGDKDLSIRVDYARYYARTLYERELHDRLLNEVLAAEPVVDGHTLFNVMAQRQANELLDAADDYF